MFPLSKTRISRRLSGPAAGAVACALLAVLGAAAPQARAEAPVARQSLNVEELLSGVVRIRAFIDPEGRTVQTLGRERTGNGVVIDKGGLVLTIGYLIVEAHNAEVETNDGRRIAAEVVGYDYDTGFGLLRARSALNVRPLELGRAAGLGEGDSVLVARAGGAAALAPALVTAKREFAGYWEYLLEEAIFTSPPYPEWSGSALLDRDGRVVGVGSLIVADASGKGAGPPANMFVPIDLLSPILAELVGNGKVSGTARPWIGLSTDEHGGQLVVRRVAPGSPAEKAGLRKGDIISGVGGEPTSRLAELYRRIWRLGPAGVTVPLQVLRDGASQSLEVKSVDRTKHLRLDSTF